METLNSIWNNSTNDFTPLQRKGIAIALSCILLIAFVAFVLLTLEVVSSNFM